MKITKKFTRTGRVKFGSQEARTLPLRETKLFWVSEAGHKFKKNHGCAPETKRGATHRGKLYLNTISPI